MVKEGTMTPMDLFEQQIKQEQWKKEHPLWKEVLGAIVGVIIFFAIAFIAGAYQEHLECLNGRTEVCIPADFE